MKDRVRVTKRVSFEAAHFLPNYEGQCSHLHGHSYKLEITLSGLINDDNDCKRSDGFIEPTKAMVLDFSNIKNAIMSVVGKYDHSYLNDFFLVPTAEVMVVSIYKEFVEFASHYTVPEGFRVESIKLWETEDSYAEYRGEQE